jgi:glutamine amidotransferase
MTVGILSFGMGNMRSLCNALDHLQVGWKVVEEYSKSTDFSHLIIPGVGSYSNAMLNIRRLGLDSLIYDHALGRSRPVLGICLGMHLLGVSGTEGGITKGLALLDGTVDYFSSVCSNAMDKSFRIPHMGWNTLRLMTKVGSCEILNEVNQLSEFYFAHSYAYNDNCRSQCAITAYGGWFPSVIQRDQIYGVQFHPEKSSYSGLSVINAFCSI